jgi:hypothetical protein
MSAWIVPDSATVGGGLMNEIDDYLGDIILRAGALKQEFQRLKEESEARFSNWQRAVQDAAIWKQRCEHAEKDLRRCQDALMRHELDRIEDTSG